jgi:hypothetical protein
LRQTEGFVRSILSVMRAGVDAPDHTTLSRRSQRRPRPPRRDEQTCKDADAGKRRCRR